MGRLILENVGKTYGKKQALKNVTCQFENGITALLGPNGAGKTTMMNIISTLLKPNTGTVSYDGQEIRGMKARYLEKLSVQFQTQPMYKSDTAIEYLEFCGALKGLDPGRIRTLGRELLAQFGIADTGKKKLGAFSGGMRQRLALCGTFLGDPEVILLDEPSAGLDIYEREELKRFLCQLKKDRIIIVSTHIVSDIENIADNIILLRDGQIYAEGTQQEMIDRLQGRIWQLPEDAGEELPGYYSDGKRLCVSQQIPCQGAVPKDADLTDVYFGCVNAR